MSIRRIKKTFVFGTALFGVLSCAKEAGDAPKRPTMTELTAGQWRSTCVKAENFGIAESIDLEIKEGQLRSTTLTSRESDCSLVDVETTMTASLTLANEAGQSADAELTSIKFRIKPVSPVGLSTLQIREWCGIKDWALGQERDVTEAITKGLCLKPADRKQRVLLQDEKLFIGANSQSPQSLTSQPLFFVREESRVLEAAR